MYASRLQRSSSTLSRWSNEENYWKDNFNSTEILSSQNGGTFDIDKAVETLNANATADSQYACAKYVRLALEAGGLNTTGRPNSAKDYGPSLLSWGFSEVASDGYSPQKGDVVVFQNYTGGSIHGHIQMYNGSQWVSDFRQSDFWPGSGYRKEKPSYKIYRWSTAAGATTIPTTAPTPEPPTEE